MKIVLLLLALGVCANATSVVITSQTERKLELPSVSALIVTELLEVTFHVPTELAQQIGHIFRNVPLSLAKEMVAFIVKVFGDATQHHLDNLSQYMDQALNIFKQVWEHIDAKEVVELIASNLLPEKWVNIIMKLMATLGRKF
jgi:hypothetical protein